MNGSKYSGAINRLGQSLLNVTRKILTLLHLF